MGRETADEGRHENGRVRSEDVSVRAPRLLSTEAASAHAPTAITVCGTLSAMGMSCPVGSVPEVQCDINVFVDGNAEPIARLAAAQIIYVINLFLRACAFMHRYEYEGMPCVFRISVQPTKEAARVCCYCYWTVSVEDTCTKTGRETTVHYGPAG